MKKRVNDTSGEKPLVTPIDTVASDDTRECVRAVMRAVNAGECIGVAMVVMLRGRRYDLMVGGEAARDPTYARGMVASLDDELARRIKAVPREAAQR